ncbi:MAG: DNA recombination protein RmuC, partial [Shewanella sp.]
MPFAVSLTPPQIAAVIAVAFVAFLIGALINQRLTRKRWEQLKLQHEQQTLQQLNEVQIEMSRLQDNLDDKIDHSNHLQSKIEDLIGQLSSAETKADRVNLVEQQMVDTQHRLMESQLNLAKSNAVQQTILVKAETEQKSLQDKIVLLESAEERLKLQFENLANRIFEERSESFKQQNVSQIDGVLGPLKQQLEGFRRQIQESYTHEQSERSALKHQLDNLRDLNLKMSQDAINLTKALKGDNKQQGNWGEVILERVL